MAPEPLTPANSTVILVDYAVGFANVLRSHNLAEHVGNAVALAKVAIRYGSGLVVTNGPKDKPSGPLYPQLLEVLGDQPILERTQFDAFLNQDFAAAVRATGRENVIIGGISTEGCVLQTALGALRAGYRVHLVENASAAVTAEAHEIAVRRMAQAGVVPLSWIGLAAEFQVDQTRPGGVWRSLIEEHIPEMSKSLDYYAATRANAISAAVAV